MLNLPKNNSEPNDTVFFNVKNELTLYYRDSFISSDEYRELTDSLANTYVSLFLYDVNAEFKKDIWSNAKLNDIHSHIRMLRNWTNNDDEPVISVDSKFAGSFSEIEKTISDYRQAWKVARSTRFHGVQAARNTLANARYYRKLEVLSPCSTLLAALDDLPSVLERQHYNIIVSKVESLNNTWEYMDYDRYNARLNSVKNSVKEYANCSGIYGNYVHGTANLKAKIDQYKKRSDDYYANHYYNNFFSNL